MEEAIIGALSAIILALIAVLNVLWRSNRQQRNHHGGSAEPSHLPVLNEILSTLGDLKTGIAVSGGKLDTISLDCRATNDCVNSMKTLLTQRGSR